MRSTFFALLLLGWSAASEAQTFEPRVWQPKGIDDSADVEGTYVSQTVLYTKVRLKDGSVVSLKVGGLSDEDKRYLANVKSVTHPYRTWTRTARDRMGTATSETFEAALVDLVGFESPLSKRHAVVVRSDSGQRRGYALADLSAADRTYVDSVAAEFPDPPPPGDGSQYGFNWGSYKPGSSPEPFNFYATDHFVFFWGNNVQPDAANWSSPAFRQMNYAYFEKVWNYFRSIGAPMPYDTEAVKKKTNVYITRTGLSLYPEGFAFGGLDIIIHPSAMAEGSSVIPHEFGHTMQLHSGGYRNNDYVGWFWECHANWCSGSFIPGLASALFVYADRAHYELDSSRMNYGSWPFVEYFAEHPKFSRDFAFDVWRQAARDAGTNATESPLETFIRLGAERRIFPGDGVQGFGDMIGQMAAHNATWDYTFQQGYLDDIRFLYTQGIPSRSFTLLRPVPDRKGWYRPIYSQAPRQYGINVVPLELTPGAVDVTAYLDGISDETLATNWRAMFAAVDADGQARYSRMWRRGKGHMNLKPGEKVFLAVAATPDRFTLQPFRPGYTAKRRSPYEVRLVNCAPAAVPVGIRNHDGVPGHSHPKGGGFVADSATVADTAFVGKGAQVLDGAQVLGNARIEDHATVGGSAIVSDSAVVGGYAYVRENARVKDRARVGEYALVQQSAIIGGDARIREFINVQGDGLIAGNAMVKGFGDVFTGANAPVGGGTVVGQDSEIYFGDYGKPVDYGTLYGFTNGGFMDDRTDNRHCYAHWSFTKPRKRILIDDLTDNDGVLRGGAAFATDGARSVLDLNGANGYVALEGHAADAAGLTFDVQLKWRGGAANQRVFSFGGPGASMCFSPSNANGKAEFAVKKGSKVQTMQASVAVPANQWARLTITYRSGRACVYLDGVEIGSSTKITIAPSDLRATSCYIGRDTTSAGYLNGQIRDMAVYRKAFETFADLVPPYDVP